MNTDKPSAIASCDYQRGLKDAWDAVNKLIVGGELPEEKHLVRNGYILATNQISALPGFSWHPSHVVARQEVDAEHRICEHGRDAFADDCGMCDAAGTNWAAPANEQHINRPAASIERQMGSEGGSSESVASGHVADAKAGSIPAGSAPSSIAPSHDDLIAQAQAVYNLAEHLPYFEELELPEVKVRSNQIKKLRDAALKLMQDMLAKRSATGSLNAERYEWLRLHFRFAEDSMREIWFDASINHSALKGQSAEELDRAIDQARAAEDGKIHVYIGATESR